MRSTSVQVNSHFNVKHFTVQLKAQLNYDGAKMFPIRPRNKRLIWLIYLRLHLRHNAKPKRRCKANEMQGKYASYCQHS